MYKMYNRFKVHPAVELQKKGPEGQTKPIIIPYKPTTI